MSVRWSVGTLLLGKLYFPLVGERRRKWEGWILFLGKGWRGLGGSFAALVPDRDVRVSVKALALSCVGAAVALHPESFFSKLYKVPLDTMESAGMLKVHFFLWVNQYLSYLTVLPSFVLEQWVFLVNLCVSAVLEFSRCAHGHVLSLMTPLDAMCVVEALKS